jgi:amino acid transporter
LSRDPLSKSATPIPAAQNTAAHNTDEAVLASMGYSQELSRRMKGFSNFAVSFSIICILSGGINSLGQGISSIGGASIGIGWPVGCLVSLLFALAMAQIASAFPTAGGLYHWGSVLGGRGWGWLTAWLNLIGLVTVLGAINVGTYGFFMGAFGLSGTYFTQAIFVVGITVFQALINHFGIRLTTRLTDLSGYLIFAVTIVLTLALLYFAKSLDISRLWTFTNYSGPVGGDVWPQSSSLLSLFLLCLLLPIYTITGFDASAHTAEETVDAQRVVPRGIVSSVVWSALFGWVLLCAFVLAIPDLKAAAASGFGVFFQTINTVIPQPLRTVLYIGVLLAQLLCGLATVTSVSRMTYAFARDGGLPFSGALRRVQATLKTPVAAIWTTAIISVLFTLFTSVYTTIVSVTVIFLFLSYGLPIVLGLFAYGRTWTRMGPWNMGPLYRLVAGLVAACVALIFFVGVQPPNGNALKITLGFLVLTAVIWYGLERRRFQGPPSSDLVGAKSPDVAARLGSISSD